MPASSSRAGDLALDERAGRGDRHQQPVLVAATGRGRRSTSGRPAAAERPAQEQREQADHQDATSVSALQSGTRCQCAPIAVPG